MLDRLTVDRASKRERREHIVDVLTDEHRWQTSDEIMATLGDATPSSRTVARDLRVLQRTNVVEVMEADLEFGGPTKYYTLAPTQHIQ